MASVVEATSVFSEEHFTNVMDRNNITQGWVMMATPVPMLMILTLYGFVLLLGPQLMESREAYKLKKVMRLYNIFQVIHNMYMVYSFIENPQALPFAITISCAPVDIEDKTFKSLSYAFLYYSWNFLVSKHIDLLDTVFMVLRKKNSHITFLHVYHHVAMVFFTWLTVSHTKSPHGAIPALINVIIHCIMYSYYFLATFNRFKRLLWWKQHLTKLQLGQFVIILLYIFLLYYYECPISRTFTFTWLFNVFVFLILFLNFYIKAYMLKSDKSEKKIEEEGKTKYS